MTETTDAGRTARTGTEESREDKGTANTLVRTLTGALAGAVVGFIEGLTDDQQASEQGYHASIDDGRVAVTHVPERGSQRHAMSLRVGKANDIYRVLSSDDGETETYRIESTASGEVLQIYAKDITGDLPVIEVLADDRDSLQHALANVLEDRGAAELLEGVKGVFLEDNDFEVVDADRAKVSYCDHSRFGPDELAALRDSDLWICGITPGYIVVREEGSTDD